MRRWFAILLVLGLAEARPTAKTTGNPGPFCAAGSCDVIERDPCTTFPVTASANSGTVTSVTAANLCSTAGGTVVVCAGGYANSVPNAWGTISMAWATTNNSCTGFTSRRVELSGTTAHGASIWTATCSSSFSGIGATLSAANGSGSAVMAVACDVLMRASVGSVSNGANWNGASTASSTTLSGVTSKSWLYVATGVEPPAAMTPVADTSEMIDVTNGTGPTDASAGVNLTGTSGNISVGWSTTSNWGAVAAFEILKQ